MTTHYGTSHWFGDVFVSVDNRNATKVSVWVSDEETPRKRFAGSDAYGDAMDFAIDLDYQLGSEAPVVTSESVAIALGGIPADDDSDY